MPRPSIGDTPMTGAERQARYRAMHANGEPVIRVRRMVDRRQPDPALARHDRRPHGPPEEYAAWLEALPANQRDSTTAEALAAIVDLDLSELQAIEPPRGFGRD